MAIIPKITVVEQKTTPPVDPTHAGRICFIGAFDKTKDPATVTGAVGEEVYSFVINNIDDETEAYDKLGTDTTTYAALKCIPHLFKGATSMVSVNMTVDDTTPDLTITANKLGQALNALLLEKFDMLFVAADSITDELLAVIKAFYDKRLEDKRPFDYVGYGTRANIAAYETSVALMPRSCNFIMQPLEDYSLMESGALMTGFIASNILGLSLTNKIVPDVDELDTELTFGAGDDGYKLVQNGYTIFKITNRLDSEVQIVNGRQFNGFDGYINRVTNAIIRDFNLEQFLGAVNNNPTLMSVQAECARIKDKWCTILGYAKDIEYYVEKASPECVVIKLSKIVYDGVITEIELYYTIEVE